MKGHPDTLYKGLWGGVNHGESMVNLSFNPLRVSFPVLFFLFPDFVDIFFDCFVIMTRQVQSYLWMSLTLYDFVKM